MSNINCVALLTFLIDANSFCIVSGIKYPYNFNWKLVFTNLLPAVTNSTDVV